MDKSSYEKGISFEEEVGTAIEQLRRSFPSRVSYRKQPHIKLDDNRLKKPDFELEVKMPYGREQYLIECQSRKRSQSDIADKIYRIKSSSNRNRFIFIYADAIPPATEESLKNQGDIVFSFDQFLGFINRIIGTLKSLKDYKPPDDDFEPPPIQMIGPR